MALKKRPAVSPGSGSSARAAPVISIVPGGSSAGDLRQRAGVAVQQEGEGRFRPDQMRDAGEAGAVGAVARSLSAR